MDRQRFEPLRASNGVARPSTIRVILAAREDAGIMDTIRRLLPKKSVLEGAGRVFDLGGRRSLIGRIARIDANDMSDLSEDWRAVRGYLQDAQQAVLDDGSASATHRGCALRVSGQPGGYRIEPVAFPSTVAVE